MIYKALTNIKHAGSLIVAGEIFESEYNFKQQIEAGVVEVIEAKDKEEAKKIDDEKTEEDKKAQEEAEKNKPQDTWSPKEGGENTWASEEEKAEARGDVKFEQKEIGNKEEKTGDEKTEETGDNL